MITNPYWINSQLAIVPRPRGGDWLDDEMLALRDAGIDVVVSMLEDNEAAELGLAMEENAARQAGLAFARFVISDRGVPLEITAFRDFLKALENHLDAGRRVGIHCRACIGRASVTSASLLLRSGMPPEKAWMQIAEARGCAVPDTAEQRAWVDQNMRSQP